MSEAYPVDYSDLKIIDNPMLVRDHALDRLRTAISTGLYPPGTRLVERELCEALGISRTSVREALRQLQSESLIEVGKRRNIAVAIVTAQDAHDIYTVREMLETDAVRRLVDRNDPETVKRLTRIHKDLQKALNKGNVQQLAAMAGTFYETILQGCGSKVIHDVARPLLARVNYLRLRSMGEPGRLEQGIQEWDRLMEAIQAGNADAAVAAMRDHLINSRKAIVAKLEAENGTATAADAPPRRGSAA
ncbi:GntR family transcriptional regulator [Niveispirillum fermenti]|uniref:GntR family transcriptional regulator n=1 Tax=Niveispirillum fermenti TaxID=1233113 RepID=UPI003A89EE30